MKILAVIPARGGSKRIPKKNLVNVCGKPLIAHTISHALRSDLIDQVVVSTDDTAIARVSVRYGAKVIERPRKLSSDFATSESAILHVLDVLKQNESYVPDLIVFLQCTAPLRRKNDIDNAIRLFLREKADSLLSAVRRDAFIWQFEKGRPRSLSYDIQHRKRTQDFLPTYEENGSIFIFKTSLLQRVGNRLGGKIVLYEMSYWSRFDIDNREDLELVKLLMKYRFHEKAIRKK